jgi:hypothetical protein
VLGSIHQRSYLVMVFESIIFVVTMYRSCMAGYQWPLFLSVLVVVTTFIFYAALHYMVHLWRPCRHLPASQCQRSRSCQLSEDEGHLICVDLKARHRCSDLEGVRCSDATPQSLWPPGDLQYSSAKTDRCGYITHGKELPFAPCIVDVKNEEHDGSISDPQPCGDVGGNWAELRENLNFFDHRDETSTEGDRFQEMGRLSRHWASTSKKCPRGCVAMDVSHISTTTRMPRLDELPYVETDMSGLQMELSFAKNLLRVIGCSVIGDGVSRPSLSTSYLRTPCRGASTGKECRASIMWRNSTSSASCVMKSGICLPSFGSIAGASYAPYKGYMSDDDVAQFGFVSTPA